ncbi:MULTISPECIES: hypothetical protein [Pseudomonas]|uniref:hypothetical protein n=1 Tax=Pseudomonas TaxID=286 RepID=UPI00137B75F1|nr:MULTISPECIES: hypothetical protein [Pseudomonas]WBM31457.1 hypothetical protein M2J80_18100 [Pseudomonas sp. NY11382]
MKLRTSCMLAILGLLTLDTAFAGNIEFAEKWDSANGPGGDRCSINVEVTQYEQIFDFKDASTNTCKNDQMTFFKLNNVPSSAEIGLYSEAKCRETNTPDWYFKLKTYKDPVSTAWIEIPGLEHVPPSGIVKAGLRRMSYVHNQGKIKGKLSCVSIHLY